MKKFEKQVEVRWSDIDPNFHLRHSVFYEWGAFCRIAFFSHFDITTAFMQQYQLGPILFREECTFYREVMFGDSVSVNLLLLRARRDYSRWAVRNEIFKNNGTLAAVLTAEGAWVDTALRKLAIPPPQVQEALHEMPRSTDFQWTALNHIV